MEKLTDLEFVKPVRDVSSISGFKHFLKDIVSGSRWSDRLRTFSKIMMSENTQLYPTAIGLMDVTESKTFVSVYRQTETKPAV